MLKIDNILIIYYNNKYSGDSTGLYKYEYNDNIYLYT